MQDYARSFPAEHLWLSGDIEDDKEALDSHLHLPMVSIHVFVECPFPQ